METTTQKLKTAPKDFFLHLGVIAVLYFLVINLIQLVFQAIDFAFPKTPEATGYIPDVSFPIAALIIGFPLYLVLMRIAARGEAADPAKRELSVRKWLAYLTLFIAGAAIAVDLIILLTAFLRGEEITLGFILKVIAALIVAGTIFGYYLMDLRSGDIRLLRRNFFIGSTALVVASIIFGFMVFGSPATQRAMHFDNERVGDLQSIQWEVVNYWQAKNTVPDEEAKLSDPTRGVQIATDPRTGEAYGYEKISATSFKLCANFERESQKTGTAAYYGMKPIPAIENYPSMAQPFIEQDYWDHGAGVVCFTRTIDPNFYPKTTVTR